MTTTAEFLYAIADEIGRPRDSVVPIIKILEENWYDTAASLKSVDNDTFEKMKVPRRLVDIIREKLNPNQSQTSKPKEDEKTMMIEDPVKKKVAVKEETIMQNKISFRPFLGTTQKRNNYL